MRTTYIDLWRYDYIPKWYEFCDTSNILPDSGLTKEAALKGRGKEMLVQVDRLNLKQEKDF